MTDKNKYLLDTLRLKKLEKIMQECGVESEAYVTIYYHTDKGVLTVRGNSWFKPLEYNNEPYPKNYDSYDHADLESVFTNKTWDTITYLAWSSHIKYIQHILDREPIWKKIAEEVIRLYKVIAKALGQEKLNAMADLIILLYENGIELKKEKE